MSWFQEIAGKAETFLNAVDKGAATALNITTETIGKNTPFGSNPGSGSNSRKYSIKSDTNDSFNDNLSHFDTEFIDTPDIMSLKTSLSSSSLYSGNGNGNGNGNGSLSPNIQHSNNRQGHRRTSSNDSIGSKSSTKATIDEDRLFDYLNNKENDIPEEEWRTTIADNENVDENDDDNLSVRSSGSSSTAAAASATTTNAAAAITPTSVSHSTESKQFKLNQVKVEALSKELSTLQKRYTDLSHEYKQLQRKAIASHNQNQTNERLIKELRSKESDLVANVDTKLSQIEAFRVQYEQSCQELAHKQSQINQLESINYELQQQLTAAISAPPVNDEQVLRLEKEISNLRQSLKEERDELKRIQDINQQQISRLEDNQRSLMDELERAQRLLNDAKTAKAESDFTNSSLQKKMENLEQEYSEFKLKANKTLHDKDELIRILNQSTKHGQQSSTIEHDSLQQSSSAGGGGEVVANPEEEHIRMLQKQCDSFVNELSELNTKYDMVKSLLDRAENETIPRQQYEIGSLREKLEQEQQLSANLKSDVRQLTEESKTYQDDLNQMRSNLSTRISERDEEIEKLRKQLVIKQQSRSGLSSSASLSAMVDDNGSGGGGGGPSSATIEEWQQRLQALTESLMNKQSINEQLTSANHSLKLQLERSEQRLRDYAAGNTSFNNDVAIGIYHSPSFTKMIKHRMTGNGGGAGGMSPDGIRLLEDDPNDGNVTRKVKRAYGAIDAFSIRLGNFLRVYPSARAMFLVYIVILHLWVAFVLIYYEPEIHGPDFHHDTNL